MEPIEDIDVLSEDEVRQREAGAGSTEDENLDRMKHGYDEAAGGKQVYIETYGCQMNVADSGVVASVLQESGYGLTQDQDEADVVLLNTCAIRENAEQKIRTRLGMLRAEKEKREGELMMGVLGCMAERLREKLLEQEDLVDVVVGPDAYRDLPRLLYEADATGQAAVNVELSKQETYQDIQPVRYDSNGVSAYVSIMRGCDNMCTFCVVPFTRGREESRSVTTILSEVSQLVEEGYKEVTLLGQNVNSYHYTDDGTSVSFAELVDRVSRVSPELRVRYSTSHPKDCTDELLQVHHERPNVCNYIHLPVQHGNTEVLDRMRRTYTREEYLALTERAKELCPGVSLSTDIIAGFCGETEEQHQDTLSLMEEVRYDHAYMFKYSERPQTYAARKLEDDVPEDVKQRRLEEIIELQNQHSKESNESEIGRVHTVLVEGTSKKSDEQLFGRTDTNKGVVFDREDYEQGDYVKVRIDDCTSSTLLGTAIEKTTLEEAARTDSITMAPAVA
ncbi:tRNA (N6-isopentenyl adenosine(37)-C2)-methylthiotransferase MiaB [Salinibacter sp. 10B]|uniref:tRNA (N6-isopentenyl adenosine(37)-C2)-methylthiotransferase MiaB n=1 Tax=Salinibacter sp. 10B TaxID=1923971 RepID=UPI000CF51C07|nr:tRNA (N6-isopentenyl adenosine(37)-C2)-methylthiotransferase MiaB [Salinibacter sp. 10B]PQJ36447.1 tRNA (N6-isopentenyl adenosine(37)-C2)-methylthiotransferase MiaB [Salinibacter sp. 10B]